MPSDIMENVYLTMQGVLCSEYCVPGVENAFADGQPCAVLYAQALEAYERLSIRLNAGAEDDDVEIMIDSLLDISQILAYKMYHYGAVLGNKHDDSVCCEPICQDDT